MKTYLAEEGARIRVKMERRAGRGEEKVMWRRVESNTDDDDGKLTLCDELKNHIKYIIFCKR